ncbi:MAG: hypothetical protein C0407_01170 [Desulfobacca sp.]|nr:hypothetical protein [Desulfobacca sp.]
MHHIFLLAPLFSYIILFPSLVNTNVDQAKVVLAKFGLNTSVQKIITGDKQRNNFIADQNPGPGQKVNPGTVIQLQVYEFQAALVEVPNVTGAPADKGNALLLQRGFKVGMGFRDTKEKNANNIIYRQTPAAGTKVAPGTTVQLEVFRYKE